MLNENWLDEMLSSKNSERVILTPSENGKDCLGNGTHEDIECCCDECEYYLLCFPDC